MESDEERSPSLDPFAHANERPEKEMLQFGIYDTHMDPDITVVVDAMKKLAGSLLYHWKTFPINLPYSVTEERLGLSSIDDDDDSIHTSKKEVVSFRDLFITPSLDEVEAVALDKHGNLKSLNKEQLGMIRKEGEFEVPSLHFPGEVHRWRLSNLLQKGKRRTHASFLQDIARSVFLLIVVSKKRFVSGFFSVSEGVKGWARHFLSLLDLVFGIPSTISSDISDELRKERKRYLIAELDIKPSLKKDLNAYCEYVKEKCRTLHDRSSKQDKDLQPPPIPYRYQTPTGQDIDLRLFSKDLMDYCMGILSNILLHHSSGWQVQMKTKLIKHYQGQNMANEEISKLVTEDLMNHYLDKIFHTIRTNAELDAIQRGLGDLLVNQAKSVLAIKKALSNIKQNMEMHENQLSKDLFKSYPVRSLIPAWMEDQFESFRLDFTRQNLWSAHESAIALCEEEELDQAVYFLRRDLTFTRERQPVLQKELEPVKTPTQDFKYSTWIWFPRNYEVTRCENGGLCQRIPTLIRNSAPAGKYTTGASKSVSFNVVKSIDRTTSTRYPFWRWWNFLHRTWSSLWNCMFLFGIIIPWCSPVGIKALIWPTSFMPDLEQSQIDGSLFPSTSSRTMSMVSRLRALWQNISDSRSAFELAPDRGFLGKGFTRVFNQLWNYVGKGLVGSIIIFAVFLVMCIIVTLLSLVAAITCPVWVPCGVLLAHIFFILVWDIDNPRPNENTFFKLFKVIVWDMLCQGILQPIFAILVGVVVCPVSSFFIVLYALVRASLRSFWDFMLFHCLIKFKGRVPSRDGFVARRISGPGLASKHFYQILPEQALAAVEATIEKDELNAWRDQMISLIQEPTKVYRKFMNQCFKPFSLVISDNHGAYAKLLGEEESNKKHLEMNVHRRGGNLNTGLHSELRSKIKLPEADLKLTIAYTAKMLEELYPSRVMSRLPFSENDFWNGSDLGDGDWKGLACKKLKEIFAPSFLTPLEDTDSCFQLKVNHITIKRYADMLSSAKFHDDLDLVVEVHTPENDMRVTRPSLESSYFDPQTELSNNFSSLRIDMFLYGKHGMSNTLEVPVPILHPADIAIFIYNRENDQDPISMDDTKCQRIIDATKKVPYIDFTDLNSLEPSHTELSTPDNMTTESMTLTSHLAVQERSFSDDALSSHCVSVNTQSPQSQSPKSGESGAASLDYVDDDENEENNEKIVYCEVEKDTSCVVDLGQTANDDNEQD